MGHHKGHLPVLVSCSAYFLDDDIDPWPRAEECVVATGLQQLPWSAGIWAQPPSGAVQKGPAQLGESHEAPPQAVRTSKEPSGPSRRE